MSDLLTNRFISHSQSLKANVLSKSRSRMSRAKEDNVFDVRTCQPDAAFHTRWSQVKARAVQQANTELQRWRHNGSIILENQPAARQMLRDYWHVVGVSPSDSQLANNDWQERHPWSAAFISFLMHQAGAGSSFVYSAGHMRYVHAAKQNSVNRNMDNPFWLCNVTNAMPEPGDLICKNRGNSHFTFDTVQPSGFSHCDMVVSIDFQAGTMTVIGGNKAEPGSEWGNSVRSETITLTGSGTVNTSVHPEIFAVLKLRTDRCETCGTAAVV
jgi:hypothetical protein